MSPETDRPDGDAPLAQTGTDLKAEAPGRKAPTVPAGPYGARSVKDARRIAVWLYVMCALVAAMVTVGGATRLTDSGLSITEWNVFMGAFPPMGEQGWQDEFTRYKQIPEYHRVNAGMSIDEFKSIYWWEWGHRNLGRFIGLAYFLPFLVFLFSGAMKTRGLKLKLASGIVLIGLQGALGWYMVSSGLVERVDVSQYRLAAHLGLAFAIFAWFLWMAFNLSLTSRAGEVPGPLKPFRLAVTGFAALMSVQIFLGAMVAGLRAGKAYTDWPLMGGEVFPRGYFSADPGFHDLFETMAAVQFNHRLTAYLLFLAAIALWWFMRKAGTAARKRAGWIMMAVFFQMAIGIWTIMAAVPIGVALLHQLGALALIAIVLINAYHLTPARRAA